MNMGVTVGVNGKTVVHKSSSGTTIIFPDVCKTPSPGGPIPIPYPNVAKSSDTASGSSSVKMDGNSIMLKSSNFSTSTGDEAGTAGGGVASNTTKGKAEFVNYSFDVKVEGKNVPRALDPMIHNKMSSPNTPPSPLIQPPSLPALEAKCPCCNKDHDPSKWRSKKDQGDTAKDLEKLKRNIGA
jgi:Toxin PAAR-like domain